MRRRRSGLLLAGALALTACGSDDDQSDDRPEVTVTASVPTAPSTGGEVVASDVSDVSDVTSPTTGAAVGSTIPADAVVPEGFEGVQATVTLADGTVCELCVWLADTPARRRQGLMGVTHLGGADGMVFLYEAPTDSSFWMRGTPMPLSIAFFDGDGAFVSTRDMQPCLEGPDAECARYGADGSYTTTIELPLGDVARLGIGEGSRLELADVVGCIA